MIFNANFVDKKIIITFHLFDVKLVKYNAKFNTLTF